MSRTVWRIVKDRFAGSAYDGEGARLWGGRWNRRGTPMVYASASLSLAALEMFVHVDPDIAPSGFVAVPARLPATLSMDEIALHRLPAAWRSYPSPASLKDFGEAWIREQRSVVLEVPSVVIPQEHNLLLNPAHPDFPQIGVGVAEPFSFDPRMWKKL